MSGGKKSGVIMKELLAVSLFSVFLLLPFPSLGYRFIEFGKTYYVVTSVANLRDEPNQNAKIVAKLPIATEIEVRPKPFNNGWAVVTVRDGASMGKTGWIDSRFLVDERPTVQFLLDSFQCTPARDTEKREQWRNLLLVFAQVDSDAAKQWESMSKSGDTILNEKNDVIDPNTYVGKVYLERRLQGCTLYEIGSTETPSKEISGKTLRIDSANCGDTRMFWLSEFVINIHGKQPCCTRESVEGACWRIKDVVVLSPLGKDEEELGMPYGFGGSCHYGEKFALSTGRWVNDTSTLDKRGIVSRAWVVNENTKKLDRVASENVQCLESYEDRD